jgi:hypothetical protein
MSAETCGLIEVLTFEADQAAEARGDNDPQGYIYVVDRRSTPGSARWAA